MATKKTSGTEMDQSFGDRSEAAAFARFLTGIGIPSSHRPLTIDGREIDTWWRVVVPVRQLARATELRRAWEAHAGFLNDRREAESDTPNPYASAVMSSAFAETTDRLHRAAERNPDLYLTDARRAFLEEAAQGEANPWNHASGPVAFAKRLGWVRPIVKGNVTRYEITDAGRAVLEGTGCTPSPADLPKTGS